MYNKKGINNNNYRLEKTYRPGVGALIFNKQNKIFAGRRVDAGNTLQMPQGGVESGEDLTAALFREMMEEIGTNNAQIIYEFPEWLSYDFPPPIAARIYKGRYRGQKLKWFILQFTGQDSDINIATAHPEFRSWNWETPEQLLEKAVAFKKPMYNLLVERFLSIINQSAHHK